MHRVRRDDPFALEPNRPHLEAVDHRAGSRFRSPPLTPRIVLTVVECARATTAASPSAPSRNTSNTGRPVSALIRSQIFGISAGSRSSWLMVIATTGRSEISSSASICRSSRVHGVAREAVVLRPRRSVLENDDVRSRGGENLESSGIGRVQQAPLTLDDDHLGPLVVPRAPHRVLDLAGHEIADQAVQHDAVARSLQPRRLPGTDHDAGMARRIEGIVEQPGRGPLADRRVGAEERDLERLDLGDLAVEKVQLRAWRRFADVAKHDSLLLPPARRTRGPR